MAYLISLPYAITFGVLIAIIGTVGILANLVVVVAILGDKKMRRSAMNILLLNLAIADVLFLALHSFFWLQRLYHRDSGFHLPKILCPPSFYLTAASIAASILTYIAIAVERYIAIVHPMAVSSMGFLTSRTHSVVISVVVWLLVLIYDAPNLVYTRIYLENNGIWACKNQLVFPTPIARHPLIRAYHWSQAFITYLLPITLSVLLYWRICRKLWSANALIHTRDEIAADIAANQQPKRSIVASGQKITEELERRKNVVKMLIGCVSLFFICYTPMVVNYVMQAIYFRAPPWIFRFFVPVLGLCCSAFNPFIYTLFSDKFRDRVAKMFPGLRRLAYCCSSIAVAGSRKLTSSSGIWYPNAHSTRSKWGTKISSVTQPKISIP